MNYVLTVAEEGGDFRKILWCMGILMAAIAVSTVTFAIYKHYVFPRGMQTLYQALRMEIYKKAKEIDLSCYDDKDFYETFILATEETDRCLDRFLVFENSIIARSVGISCTLIYCAYINPLALLILAVVLPLSCSALCGRIKRQWKPGWNGCLMNSSENMGTGCFICPIMPGNFGCIRR